MCNTPQEICARFALYPTQSASYTKSLVYVMMSPSLLNELLNTLRPRQNGRRFADDTFKRIFLNENVIISIKISLKFVPKAPIYNNPSLVQIMAWSRSGDKPLSEPMMVCLLTHICITRPQWVKVYKRMTPVLENWSLLCIQMALHEG